MEQRWLSCAAPILGAVLVGIMHRVLEPKAGQPAAGKRPLPGRGEGALHRPAQFTWAPDSRTRRSHFGVSLRTSAAAASGLSLTTAS